MWGGFYFERATELATSFEHLPLSLDEGHTNKLQKLNSESCFYKLIRRREAFLRLLSAAQSRSRRQRS